MTTVNLQGLTLVFSVWSEQFMLLVAFTNNRLIDITSIINIHMNITSFILLT